MKSLSQSLIEESSAFKTWCINTWGGGTPFYLVTAKTKERAWELVEISWSRTFHCPVGELREGHYQTIDNLLEIPGVYGSKEYIVDLYEDLKK